MKIKSIIIVAGLSLATTLGALLAPNHHKSVVQQPTLNTTLKNTTNPGVQIDIAYTATGITNTITTQIFYTDNNGKKSVLNISPITTGLLTKIYVMQNQLSNIEVLTSKSFTYMSGFNSGKLNHLIWRKPSDHSPLGLFIWGGQVNEHINLWESINTSTLHSVGAEIGYWR